MEPVVMQYRTVGLAGLELGAGATFRFRWTLPGEEESGDMDEPLVSSIGTVGMISPPVLIESGGRYEIVSGFRRIAAQDGDPVRHRVRGRAVEPVRARGPVAQPRPTFGSEPGHPFAYGLHADAEPGGHLARGLAKLDNAADKFCSTQRRQARILMTVHPVLPGHLKSHNSSILGPGRTDNL